MAHQAIGSAAAHVEEARKEVNAGLAALWPLLLDASKAADGPNPGAAARPLRAGAVRLLDAAERLSAGGDGTFLALADEMQEAYRREVERLATELESQILAGEFSGLEDEGRGGPKHLRLREELVQTHPWAKDERAGRIAFACSRWRVAQEKALNGLTGWEDDPAEAMAHDVLAVAAERGWVKPMRYLNDSDLYAVKAARRAGKRRRAA
jgi:hypothetical protein